MYMHAHIPPVLSGVWMEGLRLPLLSPQARLKLLPHQTGELHILGVVYNLGTAPSAAEGGSSGQGDGWLYCPQGAICFYGQR